jgi:hypothetical protein
MTDEEKAAKAKAEQEAKDAEAKAKREAEEAAKKKTDEEKAAKAKAKRSTFHVVGPGSVHVDGETYAAGAEIELTDAESAGLGTSVAKGKAPPKGEEIAQRRAGRYRVAGPGFVWYDGKARGAGYEFDCDETEARRLGAAIQPV